MNRTINSGGVGPKRLRNRKQSGSTIRRKAATKLSPVLSRWDESDWLGRVREVREPIDLTHPLKVKHRRVTTGVPAPSIPYPERHPYCEINLLVQGSGEQFLGTDKTERLPGDVILIGPGIPHYGIAEKYPFEVIVVYFLPVVLFEMGPGGDGARMLARFTSSRSVLQGIVKAPKPLQARFTGYFQAMLKESEQQKPGWEFAVRARLMDTLVELMRWEESTGKGLPKESPPTNWLQMEKILQFVYRHFAEPLYIEQIAREAGLSADNLNMLFHQTFGMSCVQYLRAYRISHAASLLCLPGARVTEVAFSVGFETLSHFNTSFRRFQGVSPREYIQSHKLTK
jgi:AraC-like DNA-binding protein